MNKAQEPAPKGPAEIRKAILDSVCSWCGKRIRDHEHVEISDTPRDTPLDLRASGAYSAGMNECVRRV